MGLTRRTFVGSLAGAIAGATVSRRADAQTPTATRLLVVFTPNGIRPERWSEVLEPLEPVRSQITVVNGVGNQATRGHDFGMRQMLTASGPTPSARSVTGGRSLDQYVADHIGGTTALPSLELGVQSSAFGANYLTRMSYRDYDRAVPPNEDPRDVHRRLFASETDAARLYAKRRSVLDLVRAEVRSLSNRLGAEERRKMDAQLEALRDVERGFEPRPECEHRTTPFSGDPSSNDEFPAIGRAQMDLLALAFACDLTRVGSLMWSHSSSETVCTWLGHQESLHSLSHMEPHQPAGVEQFVESGRWFAAQFAYLVGRLAALPEPTAPGSVLDHSLVLWISEVGDGVSHVCDELPIVLAGGAGGRLTPGRNVTYQLEPHARLFTTICRAFGLENDSFGDADRGEGILEGLLA